jgi:serine/threonine-protein kinase
MSPEQCRGDDVDARSDLFSVGSVLYELLSGTRAFTGRNSTDVTQRLLNVEPRDLTEFVPGVPMSLAGALRRAMAKPREARFASAQVMADALRGALRSDAATSAEPASEQTMVMVHRPMPAPATPPSAPTPTGVIIDDATLDTIERRLAQHVGPIARHLVRDAARRANSIEALCEAVAHNIGQATERERFIADGRNISLHRGGGTAIRSTASHSAIASSGVTGSSNFSTAQIERVERALTRALGPIAKLLVRRALPNAATEQALWERLATHIERAPHREIFLRQRQGG